LDGGVIGKFVKAFYAEPVTHGVPLKCGQETTAVGILGRADGRCKGNRREERDRRSRLSKEMRADYSFACAGAGDG
jgi:hypothetical protein